MSLQESFASACKLTGPLEVSATHRADGTVRSYAVGQPFAFVGRAQGMTVRLDDPSVSQCHAFLQVVEGVPYVLDLGSRTGLGWDDGVSGGGCVYPGRILRVGVFDVRIGPAAGPVAGPPPDGEAESDSVHDRPPPPAVQIHHPGGEPTGTHPLERPITLVGRHPNCHLRFLTDAVSYFQCALVNTPDGVWCVDLLTRKGTLLNGRSVRLARVRDGDLIEFGKVSLVLRTGPSAAGYPLVLNGSALTAGPDALLPKAVADSVASAVTPFREVMDQFQQCFVTLARMFTTVQQEHASMMCEQMRQIQELTRELRELRGDLDRGGKPAAVSPASPPVPAPPIPSLATGTDAKALADAHAWFLDRLARMGQQPGNPKQG